MSSGSATAELAARFLPQEPFTGADFGISGPLQSLFPGAPTISIINMMDLGPSPLADNFSQVETYSYGDMLTMNRGRHTIKVGVDYKRQVINLFFNAYTRGQVYFRYLCRVPGRHSAALPAGLRREQPQHPRQRFLRLCAG